MVASERLKPVRRVAESREREAARLFGDAQRILSDQESKLAQLQLFQQEYQERFDTACRNGLSVSQLRDFLAFLAKLQQAVAQQEAAVARSRHDSLLRKGQWQEQHTRTQAIGKVIDRYRRDEVQEQERRDQKDSDERAQRGGRYADT